MIRYIRNVFKGVAAVSAILAFTSMASADTTQCVTNNGDYQITVDWYDPGDIVIDNSEPWNNRLLLRRDKKQGTGACGPDAETGKMVCQGVHVKPKQSKLLRSLAVTENKQSCVTSPNGDMFAIVKCNGCTTGTTIASAAAGTVAGMALPGGNIGSLIHSVTNTQGLGLNATLDFVLAEAKGKIRVKGKVSQALKIHDTSDLADSYTMSDVIFVGTPSNLQSKGAFFSAHAYEIQNKTPKYAYRYRLEIDCFMSTNGLLKSVEYTDTRDSITVEFKKNGKIVSTKTIKGDDINCGAFGADTAWTSDSLAERIDSVAVRTTGEDAFLIDELKLKYYQVGLEANGTFEVDIGGGTDDEWGWCLSKDTDDKFPGHAQRCIPAWRWDVKNH